jgi:hypothetical protein
MPAVLLSLSSFCRDGLSHGFDIGPPLLFDVGQQSAPTDQVALGELDQLKTFSSASLRSRRMPRLPSASAGAPHG